MTQEAKQEKLQSKMTEILKFAESKKVAMGAVQKVSQEGYIETVIAYKDLEVYPDDPKITDVEATPK